MSRVIVRRDTYILCDILGRCNLWIILDELKDIKLSFKQFLCDILCDIFSVIKAVRQLMPATLRYVPAVPLLTSDELQRLRRFAAAYCEQAQINRIN